MNSDRQVCHIQYTSSIIIVQSSCSVIELRQPDCVISNALLRWSWFNHHGSVIELRQTDCVISTATCYPLWQLTIVDRHWTTIHWLCQTEVESLQFAIHCDRHWTTIHWLCQPEVDQAAAQWSVATATDGTRLTNATPLNNRIYTHPALYALKTFDFVERQPLEMTLTYEFERSYQSHCQTGDQSER
jgi:hypothetical protein